MKPWMVGLSSVDAHRYVLGVNTGPHDAAAALLCDGDIVAMVEQERLSRRRHAFGESPADAISTCLAHAGIGLDSVSDVAVGWNVPLLAEIEEAAFDQHEFAGWLFGSIPRTAEPNIRFIDHHLAHAASAFYTSGMTDAAIIVADGRGESVATTLAVGSPSGIETVRTWGTQSSLGHYYGWASEWAGLGLWGTGKLMGLAAYGEPAQAVPLIPMPDGYHMEAMPSADTAVRFHFALHRRELRAWFRKNSYPFSEGHPADVMAHAAFAASVQRSLEGALLSLASLARRETGLRNVVFAGGVALNCSANGALFRSGIFDEIWIPPFPHDAGVSLGAALIAAGAGRDGSIPKRLEHAFLAPDQPAPDPNLFDSVPGVDVEQLGDPDLARVVARDLAEGSLVGWFQGRAEVGQRALGARSILCDPRKRRNLVWLNEIKGREPWRPLAPAILSEHFASLIGHEPPAMSDFMLAALEVRDSARDRIQAAVHVDGTARPQSVDASHGRYHALIRSFEEITGVPALINTSFNLAGSPIVHSVEDALETFAASDLDAVVVDDYYVRRSRVRSPGAGGPRLQGLSFTPWVRRTSSSPAGEAGRTPDVDA